MLSNDSCLRRNIASQAPELLRKQDSASKHTMRVSIELIAGKSKPKKKIMTITVITTW